MADKSFGWRPDKAKKADRLLFTRSSFDEFPDLWVSDLDYNNPQKITDLANRWSRLFGAKLNCEIFSALMASH